MFGIIKKGLFYVAKQTGPGRRILQGINEAKVEMQFEFEGLPSGTSKMMDQYLGCFGQRIMPAVRSVIEDSKFKEIISRYIKKNKIMENIPDSLSMDEIVSFILQKSGVGASKFAQIISSDSEIMSRFSPEVQAVIKKTQSDNPFSRTLCEAQDIVNKAFSSKQKLIGTIEEGAMVKTELELIRPLSAGTVGEAYLAKTADGQEVIVKMIKQNVDKEQLELEEQIFTRLLYEFAPNEATAQIQTKMLHNLYKDWSKELNFTQELKYNQQLRQGAQRFDVANIIRMSEDGSCIIMEKAPGIQMNDLMKMLQDYKENPQAYFTKYAKEIEANEWLREPERIIDELPTCITRAFDEQFMFMKEGGTSIMHGDPHMGNYFITVKDGVLRPVFIDTGNCVMRRKEQICEDISFLANYFVGNSRGLAEYFVKRCSNNEGIFQESSRLLSAGEHEEALIKNVADDIQKLVFEQRANITDVDKITKTMQSILENHGLNLDPEGATALKAQMQFYTGINEAAALSGRTIDVATIVKDMPKALYYMFKNSANPLTAIRSALSHGYSNQTQSARCIYQFLAPKCDIKMTITSSPQELKLIHKAIEGGEKGLALA